MYKISNSMSFVALTDGKKEETKESEKDRISMFGKEIFGEDFKNGLSDDDEHDKIAEIEATDTFCVSMGEIDFQIDEIG